MHFLALVLMCWLLPSSYVPLKCSTNTRYLLPLLLFVSISNHRVPVILIAHPKRRQVQPRHAFLIGHACIVYILQDTHDGAAASSLSFLAVASSLQHFLAIMKLSRHITLLSVVLAAGHLRAHADEDTKSVSPRACGTQSKDHAARALKGSKDKKGSCSANDVVAGCLWHGVQ